MSDDGMEFCSHGVGFTTPCERCEIVGLKESIKWMSAAVQRDKKRLHDLQPIEGEYYADGMEVFEPENHTNICSAYGEYWGDLIVDALNV